RIVLCWLKMDGGSLKQFVSNRVGEILETSKLEEWNWIPTAENVADEATRDNKPVSWDKDSRWLNGPSFLKEDESLWPKEIELKKLPDIPVDLLEVRKEFVLSIRSYMENLPSTPHPMSEHPPLILATAQPT